MPGVYAKIFAQREWIVDTICSDSTILPSFCSGFTLHPTRSPSPSASPTISQRPTVQCFNVPYWFDSYGNNCAWYGAKAHRCDTYGDLYYYAGTNGLSASEACCVCGGGTSTQPPRCDDALGWVDSFNDSCRWYEADANRCTLECDDVGPDGQTANQACCVCGGGTTTCEDDPDFTFVLKKGGTRKCSWFTADPVRAPIRKSRYCGHPDISNACSETCGICEGACYDNPSFTFVLGKNGKTRDCTWFTAQPDKTALRISTYCGRADVSNGCRETCGSCV